MASPPHFPAGLAPGYPELRVKFIFPLEMAMWLNSGQWFVSIYNVSTSAKHS